MLSMRNRLSLHPMFFPEGLQPPQLPQMRMDPSEENRSIPSNTTATLPIQQENPMPYSSTLPNKQIVADQPSMSAASYLFNSETSFRLESHIPENIRSFQLRSFSEVSSLFSYICLVKSITIFIFYTFPLLNYKTDVQRRHIAAPTFKCKPFRYQSIRLFSR